MKDLEGFKGRYGLNSRLVKSDGSLVEEVYRATAGTRRRSPKSSGTSRRRIPFAPNRPRRRWGALIQWYRPAKTRTARKYDIAWVQDKDSPVDTINGFIEVISIRAA